MNLMRLTRRTLAVLAVALAACASPVAVIDASAPKEVRITKSGPIRGVVEEGSIHFRGIPYARPPVGELRWAPPQPVAAWKDVRDAVEYGPSCMQRGTGKMSEDCLTLNVSIPDTARAGDRLPVLVRIHGGGFVSGNGPSGQSAKVWNPHGVVLVTMNYRLGALGYFAHPALRRGGKQAANYGLLDLKASLQWVHDNIAAFGGDPKRVTITGVSAGGEAVQLLMVMPGVDGLFAQAISSSGYALWPMPKVGRDAETVAQETGKKAVGSDGALTAAQLRALPPEKIIGAVGGYISPVIDGVTITDEPIRLYASGKAQPVPFMTGGNSYEGSVYAPLGFTEEALKVLLGSRWDEAAALYADDFAVSRDRGVTRMWGDLRYVLSCAMVAGEQSKRQKAWLYYVSYVRPEQRAASAGASHGGETPLLETGGPEGPGPAMQRYWANFIKTGDPNGQGLAPWPKADVRHSQWMVFDDPIRSGDVLRVKLDKLADVLGLSRP